ncbi:MAG: hypothetical protein ABJ360_09540 [Roseobacter sp.]
MPKLKWEYLEHIERAIIAVASIAALFPLYQWYSESDAREFDRAVNLVASGAVCEEWINQIVPAVAPTANQAEPLSMQHLRDREHAYDVSMVALCDTTLDYLIFDPLTREDFDFAASAAQRINALKELEENLGE